MAAHCAPSVESEGHFGGITRMGKHFAIVVLLAGFVVVSRAQSPSQSPGPTPQNAAPAVVATPTPAPVLETQLVISIPDQKLAVLVNDKLYKTYKISTSRYGEGDARGSWCTPTGRLAVATKIGASVPFGGVFQRRRYTGEVLSINAPGRDPIVSRIIWLRGLDYTNKNAFDRCIYIHGTPDEDSLGKKASYGCIRMRSSDVIEIFNWITTGTGVAIVDKGITRAIKDLADDRLFMATNAPKSEEKYDWVR
jgi:lipoprotein-anchoring transpeptidase ErfK/SrfK